METDDIIIYLRNNTERGFSMKYAPNMTYGDIGKVIYDTVDQSIPFSDFTYYAKGLERSPEEIVSTDVTTIYIFQCAPNVEREKSITDYIPQLQDNNYKLKLSIPDSMFDMTFEEILSSKLKIFLEGSNGELFMLNLGE